MRIQPLWLRILNLSSVMGFFVCLALLGLDIAAFSRVHTVNPLSIVLAAFIGYVFADLASGFVHFLGDTFGDPKTPILGPAFIFPFREHHVDPEAITHHDFIETNGHNCLVSIPVMIVMHVFLAPLAPQSSTASILFTIGMCLVLSVFMTNQFHKWAHMKKRPAMITLLQKSRFILSPEHHRIHHTAPFCRYYCITTGWLNFFLDKTRFFPISKAVIQRIPFMLKPAEKYGDT